MPVFLIAAVLLIFLSCSNRNVARYVIGSLLKSTFAIVVIMATIIVGVMVLSSLQVP
jgi:hypothetical protein